MRLKVYDVIVIGTGAGGGTAIKTLCEAGLKVLALNNGRRIIPEKDYRNHRQPYDMQYRGFGDPRLSRYHVENEYTQGFWEHDITYVNAPGTNWEWVRCKVTGGKANFWGRSSCRFGDIDFKAATLDGFDVDWPVTYDEMAPYFTRAERMMGVASTVQNRPSNPDGSYLPPLPFRCGDYILQKGAEKVGIPYLPDRIAQLTTAHNGHPPCHYCGNCSGGCDTGSFFSPTWFTIPDAEKTGNLEIRTDAIARHVLVDENGEAKGVLTWTATPGRKSKYIQRRWWWRHRALKPRTSCSIPSPVTGQPGLPIPATSWDEISVTTYTTRRFMDSCRNS